MSDVGSPAGRLPNDRLVAELVADLRPVRRAAAPWKGALAWIALVVAMSVVLAAFADMTAVARRLSAAPDMWLAVVGSSLTALLAAVAACELSMPDRSARWALLPLPALVLWIGSSGMGCARQWLIAGTHDASLAETAHCLRFIIGLSIPLSLAIFLILRRGYTLYPAMAGATAGLAVAAAAASLLTLFHPFDATVEDLAVHAFAVALVVGLNRFAARFVLGSRRTGARRTKRTA